MTGHPFLLMLHRVGEKYALANAIRFTMFILIWVISKGPRYPKGSLESIGNGQKGWETLKKTYFEDFHGLPWFERHSGLA